MRRVLITGSAGFVGRHIEDYYLGRRGVEVFAFDLANSAEWCAWASTVGRKYDPGHFDIVYHCAAFVGGRKGIDGSPAYLHTYNTMLDAALFAWALHAKPKRIVYFSSSAAYPAAFQNGDVQMPLVETELDPSNLFYVPEASYGLSKLHGEQMALSVRSEVPVTILRPFSGYGSDQSLDYPFPSFIARAKAKADPFEVWGSGQQQRDWVHIDDLVDAAVLAAELEVDGPVNVCTGIGTTFDELAQLCMDEAGYSGSIQHRDAGPSNGVDYRVGDPTKLNEFFVPKVSLREGIRRALESGR